MCAVTSSLPDSRSAPGRSRQCPARTACGQACGPAYRRCAALLVLCHHLSWTLQLTHALPLPSVVRRCVPHHVCSTPKLRGGITPHRGGGRTRLAQAEAEGLQTVRQLPMAPHTPRHMTSPDMVTQSGFVLFPDTWMDLSQPTCTNTSYLMPTNQLMI